jgi:hypothetical protein
MQPLQLLEAWATEVSLKSHLEKLLEDPGQHLYCDPEFDRQIGIALS